MRIGILTLPLHVNYGGILQAYALQTVLERMGHEVVVINCPLPKNPYSVSSLVFFIYCLLSHYVLRRSSVTVKWIMGIFKDYRAKKTIIEFIRTKIHNRFIESFATLHPSEFDAIVVGSDQVWRKAYTLDIRDYFLQFSERWDVRRVAYAASFGKDNIDDYTEEEKKDIVRLLSKFEKVSVREISGVTLCRDEFGIAAVQMIDPTMLLNSEDYLALIDSIPEVKFDGNLFNYILDETQEKSESIHEIELHNCWKSFSVYGTAVSLESELNENVLQPVERWLQAFRDADAVITDSFHACVFSIVFNKPFLVFANSDRGLSRLESLLTITGQSERLVASKDEALAKMDLLKVHPDAIDRLEKKKQEAFEFLSGLNAANVTDLSTL